MIARPSAFAFKGRTEDVRRIAQILDVAHVLEGSVRTSGSRVRVTMQLGEHFFAMAADGLEPAGAMVPLARAHAERALHIDPGVSEAHALLGRLAASYDYDWAAAASRFARARIGDAVPPYVRMSHAAFYLLPLSVSTVLRVQRTVSCHVPARTPARPRWSGRWRSPGRR